MTVRRFLLGPDRMTVLKATNRASDVVGRRPRGQQHDDRAHAASAAARRGEAGFTLIEVIITVMLIGTGVVAVLGALQVGVISASVQQDLAVAEVTLRGAAEHVKSETFVGCAGTSAYASGFSPLPGADVTITSVEHWNGTLSGTRPYSGTCNDTDWPQLVTIRVTVPDAPFDLAVSTEIVKRTGS